MNSSPRISDFSDYRSFLVTYAQAAKRRNPRWSIAAWSLKLGMKDTSSVTKILRGQRNPSDDYVEKLVQYFSFKEKDAQYFRDLVKLHKIKRDPRLRLLLLEKIQRKNGWGPSQTLDDKTFSVISNWHCLAILEMTRLEEFLEDPDWISKRFRFKVSAAQAARAVDLLLSLRLLARDAQGRLNVAKGPVYTSDDVSSEAIRLYHEQMLEHAKTAIRKVGTLEREITSATFVMPADKVRKAKELIRAFKSDFESLLTAKDPVGRAHQVYQLQVQFFPLTKAEDGEPPSEEPGGD